MSTRDLKADESNFPLDSLKEAAVHLRRPFAPGAVHFKVQQGAPPAPGIIVGYIDARLVVERLNMILPHKWYDEYEGRGAKHLICRLTVDGITREDVGVFGAEGQGRADPVKTGYSDALKRAAVKFGVGVSLYAMREIRLFGGEGSDRLTVKERRTRDGNKKVYEIGPDCDSYLRDLYAGWLDLDRGGKQFGEALDHGDDPEGSVGELADVETEQPQTALDYTDPAEVEAQEKRIRELHASIDWSRLPRNQRIAESRLNAMLSGANGNGELQKVEDHLREKERAALAAMRAEMAP